MRRIERGMRTDRKRPDYHDLKVMWDDAVAACARAAKLPRFSPMHPVWFAYEWHEPDRHRDKGNVRAGEKFISDGLAKAEIIETDGNRHVAGFGGDRFFYPGDHGYRGPGVDVRIEGRVGSDVFHVAHLWIPHRLPDLNELLEAREVGAIRGARFRARAADGIKSAALARAVNAHKVAGQQRAALSELARRARAGKAGPR